MRTRCKLSWVLGIASAVVAMSSAYAALKTTPPKNVDLTGLWMINPQLSDNPKEILEKRREKSMSRRGRRGGGGMEGGMGGGMRRTGGMGGGPPGGMGGGVRRHDRGGQDEPERKDSMQDSLDDLIGAPEQLDIKQDAHAFMLSSGDQSNSCKPGEVAQVSLRDGYLADRQCGWQSKKFVIELKSPLGITRTDRYELVKKTDQLVVITELEGGRGPLKGLKIKRTYDRLVAH
jgi:hypothetical protein